MVLVEEGVLAADDVNSLCCCSHQGCLNWVYCRLLSHFFFHAGSVGHFMEVWLDIMVGPNMK